MLSALMLLGCDRSVEPQDQQEALVRLQTGLPGGTEAQRGALYVFTAQVNPAMSDLRYLWDFDDNARDTIDNTPTRTWAFPRNGWYFVEVKVQSKKSGRIIGSASTLVNVRDSVLYPPMTMVGPGTFIRGSTRDVSEGPPHLVAITKNFLIGVFEVQQREWISLLGFTPSLYEGADNPAEKVTWFDAIDYCNRLSIRSGLSPCYSIRGERVAFDPNANGYRLPTEAEWEFAARAGTSGDTYLGDAKVPLGSCLPVDTLDATLDRLAWYCLNSRRSTRPVGLKEPNAFGLYDILGNVSEWVWDEYGLYTSQTLTNPVAPVQPLTPIKRIARGGDITTGANGIRASQRDLISFPDRAYNFVGFRVCRNAP